ncbi:MAG: hypothetical protein LAO05_10360 [Acidobacteriia bacterium]|nr:hypothetical protein [Terriglobia bacterium]
MSLGVAIPFAVSAVLCGCVFLLLWLDRYRLELLPWLGAVAVWSFGGPALLLVAGSRLGELLHPPGAGGPIPELWLTSVLVIAALIFLGVALPLGLAARMSILEGPSNGAVFGVVAGLAFSGGMELLVLERTPWQAAGAALAFVCLLHAAVGAVLGAGIGLARLAVRPALRLPGVLAAAVAALVVGALLTAGAVSSWTSWGEVNVACNLALTAVGAVVLVAVFAVSVSYEARVLAGQLAEEVTLGVVPPWVAQIVPSYLRRIRSDWWPRRDERREILRLVVGLAFRKHRLRTLPEDRARLYGLEVGRMRHRARALLVDLEETAPPT